MPAPRPENEAARLEALRRYGVLGTPADERFDRVTRLVSRSLGVPIALVSLVDSDRQWFKSRIGLTVSETPRDHAFCAHVINDGQPMVVRDALEDARFKDNPLVRGEPNIRFYAGAPITTPDRFHLGTLCAIDREPRELSPDQMAVLVDLAAIVSEALEYERLLADGQRQLMLLNLAEEVAHIGHWRFDVESSELYWSPQTYRIHGLDPSGPPPGVEAAVEAYHPQDRAAVTAHMERAIQEKTGFDFELRLARADGAIRNVHSRGRVELNPETDEVKALFGVFQDVTDQQSTRARLRHAEKMASVGTLAAGVAHEVNNPLSYIKANADLLAETHRANLEAPSAEAAQDMAEMIGEIRDGTERIQRIVQDLKAFAQPSRRKDRSADLASVLATARRLCQHEVRHKARLTYDVDASTPPVCGDEAELVQVAVNLIINAAQAIPDEDATQHEIRVRTGTASRKQAYFEVTDTGRGMTDSIVPQAFNPFFTTKPQGLGTGLGLAVCHGIVTSFGGTIEMTTAPGAGTTMRVVLPLAPESQAESATKPPSAPPQVDPARILLVDDEPIVGRSLARLLRPHSVEVEQEPKQALDRLRAGEHFDAIVCDLMMPSMNGGDFHQAVGQVRPELHSRMLFITGGVFTPEGQDFVDRTDARIIQKPVESAELTKAVAELLSG